MIPERLNGMDHTKMIYRSVNGMGTTKMVENIVLGFLKMVNQK